MLNIQLILSLWKFYKERCAKFFSDIWNILDVLIVLIGWACTLMWFVRYIKGERAISRVSLIMMKGKLVQQVFRSVSVGRFKYRFMRP